MKWDQEARTIIDETPMPPMMAELAYFDAERRALRAGSKSITAAIARQTRKGYEKMLGADTIQLIEAMGRGEDPGLPDEFFEEIDDELLVIKLCPARYGACTATKREMMRAPIGPVKLIFKEQQFSRAIMAKTAIPLLTHNKFTIAITGCPNGCLSPYMSDFGIISLYRPEVQTDAQCTGCKACVKACRDNAVTLTESGPSINYQKCLKCGECVKACRAQVIRQSATGYKVVAGGSGGRHPVIARTVSEQTDLEGILTILDKLFKLYKAEPATGDELSIYKLINRHGVEVLRP